IPLLWWAARRSRTNLSRRHLAVVAASRTLAVAMLALALMQPQWHAGSDDVSVVYALDVSRSVSSSFIDSALAWIGEADREGKPAQARYLAFADRPVLLEKPEQVRDLAVTEGSPREGAVDRAATNLERALDEALMSLDRDRVKRLVLLTDGNQTEGDVWRVLARLKEANVRVFPIPAKVRDDGDAWLEGIEVPQGMRQGEPVTVIVRAFSPGEARAHVVLRTGNTVLGNRAVRLTAGLNRVSFEIRLSSAGSNTLAAELIAEGDPVADNNRAQQSAWVARAPRVLYVEGQPGSAGYLRDALAREGIEVSVAAPAGIPESAAGFAPYDAVILSDAPAKAITPARMRAIESYVRDAGGGLLFAAGENVYGEQGYSGTPVEKVLPVQFRAQEKRKDLALVIALDRSYSMRGRKMELAKEATRAALDLLEEQHQFAVVAFDSQTHISVPMQYVRAKRKAEDQIARIQASGQTNIYPALGIVYRMLQKTDAKAKHVILLSDGDTHPADFEALVKRMADEKIVVSTVAVGEGADRELMSKIAKWGGGRAYATVSAEAVPQIFIEETQRAVRSNLLEDAFKPVVKRRMEAFRGVDFEKAPPLKGYVSATARDNAEVFLVSQSGSPVLARWQYGLGKVVVFTSDVKNRWAVNWLEWPGYGKLWAQLTRETMRRDSGEELDFRVLREGGEAVVSLNALTADGHFRDDLAPRVRVTAPDGRTATVDLHHSGPGAYRLRVPLASGAAVHFELADSPGLSPLALRRTGSRRLSYAYPDEYRALPPNLELLRTLAEETGGKLAPSIAEVFAQNGDHSRVSRALWPWLAVLALLLYLLDIAARRAALAWRWLGDDTVPATRGSAPG
ncbi:MAG TPA: VWA domain-containing protein, partial [Burkholderiales bacterium]|nr:VWA domain-containing protein [Burkholderiales bacterium]